MFGQTNNQNSDNNDQSNSATESAQAQDFNPALPNPDTSFDNVDSASVQTPSAPVLVAAPVLLDDLQSIKQQALMQLSPLVSHLDQSPEEKFRTTMMMIQASDNQELVKDAYAAAQAIPDEKARAQALLDIVNEINYFTQNHAA